MNDSRSRCSEALKLVDAFLLQNQHDGSYDRWLERYSKHPGDHDDAFLFSKLVQAMFSGGMKGQVVDTWMPKMERAFHNWDIYRIARLTEEKIGEIAASHQVIANWPKLRAVVQNAATAITLTQQYGTFGRYLTSFPSISALSTDIAKRFKYLKEVTTEDFLRNIGFDTVKPDRHITRWLTRMGALGPHALSDEVISTIRTIAADAKMSKAKADAVIYLFCADRDDVISGGICGNVPACGRCPLGNLCPRIGSSGKPDAPSPETSLSKSLPQQNSTELKGGISAMTKTTHPSEKPGGSESFSPGSIGAKIYPGMSWNEILQKNPFANRTWVDEPASLTQYRKDQIKYLFQGKARLSHHYIHSLPRNVGWYPAFRAVAHGLARWDADSEELVAVG